ncbi:hypothetical protein RIR_jg15423.t1 [Rhizophagus irregularis DAOM 181602=DAOM 197198]|uniref:Uncharacterized protein n=1 Tax=Rhizophagus irregularis (strain DAOM 181602 / DAOM 197198 / MUCL 43194) TaxID=747089 RepID=U9UI26_RHIID|nr:hypothetical protein RIR_jg15423.t1 [Rhizophagus irregularis DAOM 181602=DAOM 197198]
MVSMDKLQYLMKNLHTRISNMPENIRVTFRIVILSMGNQLLLLMLMTEDFKFRKKSTISSDIEKETCDWLHKFINSLDIRKCEDRNCCNALRAPNILSFYP